MVDMAEVILVGVNLLMGVADLPVVAVDSEEDQYHVRAPALAVPVRVPAPVVVERVALEKPSMYAHFVKT